MTFNSNSVPDLYLEKYVLGALSHKEESEILLLLDANTELQKRVSAIRMSNKMFYENSMSQSSLDKIENRINRHVDEKPSERGKFSSTYWQFAATGVAMCFSLLLFLPSIVTKNIDVEIPGSEVRLKGISPALNIYRKQGEYIEKIKNHQAVKQRDVLQLGYQRAGYQYGMIFSIDGRGVVTLHFPESVGGSTRLKSDGEMALPHAYELDDAPKFERFFLLLSNSTLNVKEVLAKGEIMAKSELVESVNQLEMPDKIFQESIILSKVK